MLHIVYKHESLPHLQSILDVECLLSSSAVHQLSLLSGVVGILLHMVQEVRLFDEERHTPPNQFV